jgi:hypothetical protein
MKKVIGIIALGLLLLAGNVVKAPAETLSIRPVMQETPEWCWLAVGQMIFEHFDIPAVNPSDYQCGIIAFWGARPGPYGWQGPCMANCRACPLPAGSFTTIQAMLNQYPVLAGDQPLRFSSASSPIDTDMIKQEIDDGRPILIGITPSGARLPVSQHVALLIGYEEDEEEGEFYVVVNDPFPYRFYHIDPFASLGGEMLQPGQYKTKYQTLRDQLLWRETIYGFHQ